jgi:hypothetical protein
MNDQLGRRLARVAVVALGLALPVTVLGMWLIHLFPYHPGFLAMLGWFIAMPAGLVASALDAIAPYYLAWAIGLVAQGAVIFVVLALVTLVRRNRAFKPGPVPRKGIATALLVLANVGLAFVLVDYLKELRPPLDAPARLVPGKLAAAKRELPQGVSVDFNDLVFARGKLFVASSLGLIEVEGAKVVAVNRWHTQSRIDRVWSGPKGESIWVQHAVSSDLGRLDASGWKSFVLPTPKRGYTRGDMLSGFGMAATGNDLWLSGGSTLWRWNEERSAWETVPLPGTSSGYASVRVHAGAGQPIVKLGGDELFSSDKGSLLLTRTPDGKWVETKLVECCAEDFTAIGGDIYFRTKKGELVSVANGVAQAISTPGRVDALVVSNGQLIASIADTGIFVLAKGWKKVFDVPYASGAAHSWVHLAAHDGVIALSVAQSNEDWKERVNGLWVSSGGKLVKVEVPD